MAMRRGERGSQDSPSSKTADLRCKQVMEMEGPAAWQPPWETEVTAAVGLTKGGRGECVFEVWGRVELLSEGEQ